MLKRIPVSVEVIYDTDGVLIPKKLLYKNKEFGIERVIGIRQYCPSGIHGVSPTEYVVVIDGLRRKIYFEQSTSKWFSVKEYRC